MKSGDIGDLEVKAADVAADSLGSGKIAERSVKNSDLGLGASSSNTIADDGVRSVDVRDDDLTGADIAPGAVGASELAFDPATQPELDNLSTDDGDPPNAGSNALNWNRLGGVPAGFADGADDGTSYEGSDGIEVSGSTIGFAEGSCEEAGPGSTYRFSAKEGWGCVVDTAAGPAGGDLEGDYPSPTIAQDTVNSREVAADSLTGEDIDESTLSGVSAEGVSVPSRTTLSDDAQSAGATTTTLFDGGAFDIEGHCEETSDPDIGEVSTRITLESAASDVTFALENDSGGRSSSSGSLNQVSPPPVDLVEASARGFRRETRFADFAAVTDSGTGALSGTVLASSVNPSGSAADGTCVFSVAVLGI